MDNRYIYLRPQQAVELFCQVVAKFEADQGKSTTMEHFMDDEFVYNKLNEYDHTYESQDDQPFIKKDGPPLWVAKAIFGLKKNKKKQEVPKHPTKFYDLVRCIRLGHPVFLRKDDTWPAYLRYIDNPQYNFVRVRELHGWMENPKQRRWERQSWWMYYQDTLSDNKSHGVTRALLKFGTFGKVEINGYRVDKKQAEDYTGWFKLHTLHQQKGATGGDTLTFDLKLKEGGEKDLHIRIYIGLGKAELALGQYNNTGLGSFYTGTVMIEPFHEGDSVLERQPAFFPIGSEAWKALPLYVRLYFEDRRKNIQRVPKRMNSVADFYEWYDIKNPGKREQLSRQSQTDVDVSPAVKPTGKKVKAASKSLLDQGKQADKTELATNRRKSS